jgi:hypothetical protein
MNLKVENQENSKVVLEFSECVFWALRNISKK